ncbi:TPA: O-antigen ligase RfaL [Salmonella enterica]|uniref:O-antigen ligase RfaL n=1 Tax=Salmonella enterica TaxID=28901 RepID=A0A633LE77_SALER|nr:O-antigen ligase RfaL [Salmonella enterica]ELC8790483.1 O-antigen ligase RfaL [Salmonella enterica]EMA3634612.1 O-antigen ligase RfaL [Salmonella enterica]HAK6119455.1 O-antigen ligase RfaL [Salmonella enterica]
MQETPDFDKFIYKSIAYIKINGEKMVISRTISKKEYNWLSIWNISIVAIYFILYFLDGVTRYKHLTAGLMYITALVYVIRYRKKLTAIFKNNLTISLVFFTMVAVYSVFISVDIHYSLSKSANSIFEKLVLVSVVIPVILHREKKENVAKLFIFSLILAIIPVSVIDIRQYINEYHNGILPFTEYEHRYRSDAFIFMSLALLNLWLMPGKINKIIFLVLLTITGVMITGTLQRGTWLSVLVPSLIWVVIKKEWKLSLITIAMLICFGFFVLNQSIFPVQNLFFKLHQTDSSERYGNGTQGSAMDLIMENPIKGYGYGDDIFYRIYNSKVNSHPDWYFKKSIGPHNITLAMWYAAGIAGLFSLWYLLISLMQTALKGYLTTDNIIIKQAWLSILLITLGDMVIRGAFETVRIENLSLLIGTALALKFTSQEVG